MFKKIAQISVLSTFLLMYVTLEITLFKELGGQDGLLVNLFLTPFAIISLVGFMYRKPLIDIDEEIDEEANCCQ